MKNAKTYISFSYQYTYLTFYVKSVFINPIISNSFLVTMFLTTENCTMPTYI